MATDLGHMRPPSTPASASRSASQSPSTVRQRPGPVRRLLAMSSNDNQSVTSSAFSELTKLAVRRATDNACWACHTPEDIDVAHVIAQADTQVQLWKEAALFNSDIDFKTVMNGITLCSLCHHKFDNAADPGFVFFPTDLQFFIDFEVNDQDRRRNDGDLRRRLPTKKI